MAWPPCAATYERGEAGREKLSHDECSERDPAGHGESQLRKDCISGQGQRGECARQDQSSRTDRRPGLLECDGGSLPRFHALLLRLGGEGESGVAAGVVPGGESAGRWVDGEVGKAGEQFLQDDAGLQPGGGSAEAVVRADGES